MANLKDVIYLSAEDYNTLYTNGTVTINGTTLTYDANNVYIVPDNTDEKISTALANYIAKSNTSGLVKNDGTILSSNSVSTQSQSTKFLREDGTWQAPSYTTNTNTTYSMSRDGSSVKLTPSSGTAQSVGLSDLINGLDTGDSNAQGEDYLIAQYAGGGTTYTTYYRRAVSKIVNSTVVKSALGTGSGTIKFFREDGSWQNIGDLYYKTHDGYITNGKKLNINIVKSSFSGYYTTCAFLLTGLSSESGSSTNKACIIRCYITDGGMGCNIIDLTGSTFVSYPTCSQTSSSYDTITVTNNMSGNCKICVSSLSFKPIISVTVSS